MTDREKKELIEAEETILQLFFDAYERAMKYTKGNINLSLRMAAMLVSAMVHDQTEAMGESKKEKTDNQICKWLKDPESDSAKYKMWGNGIALPCAMFVMEGIAMILSREDTDEQK